jgi:hypothetical protein
MPKARPEITGRRRGVTASKSKRPGGPLIGKPAEIEPAATDDIDEAESDLEGYPRGPPKLALTIPQFCRLHNITVAFFYLLRARGQAPRVMKVGTRRLISIEEAKRWREVMTEAA